MLVSSLGDWVGFVAVTALVTRLGGARAGYAVAGVMIARLLPLILFGPIAGVLVDRFDRKRLMIVADIARGVGYASMPFLGSLGAIYVVSFVLECFSIVWTPAKDASIPNLVPRRQLTNANTVALLTTYGTLPLGGIVFTALTGLAAALGLGVEYLEVHEEALPLWVNGFTFVFSAYMVSGIDLREKARKAMGKFRASQAWEDIVEGVRFLRAHSFQQAMTVGIVMAFVGVGSVIAIGPIFAARTLDAGSPGWGVLVTSVGVGMGVGFASLGWLSKFVEKDTLFPLAMLATAGVAVILAAMPNLGLAAMLTVIMGTGVGITWVTGYTLLQENVSDEFRGRTFGSLTVLARLGILVSLAGFPALAQAVGDHSLNVGNETLDLSGPRLAMWVGAVPVLAGGLFARRGLNRSRLSRPVPLSLRPRLRRAGRPGTFIVFEGVEGSGKGTQIELARRFLEEKGFEVLATREPGGTELGERLRDFLLDPDTAIDARTEAMLFAAARAQHVTSVIRPALDDGKVVLCDRYLDSSLAYQGAGRGLGESDVLALNVWATQGLLPDLVVLLNLEPEEGLARAETDPDRIEAEDSAFHGKVANAYAQLAEEHRERFVVVDGGRQPHEVQEDVQQALVRFLKPGGSEA